ncbi:MAG: (d)CMP kinase [Chlorobi bacterium]|nr:(d)CMP kinase [Chlorobiota bacterium]
MNNVLFLVDIDGTLLRVDRQVTRGIWAETWSNIIGGKVPWERLDTAAGKTDLQILAQLLGDPDYACRIAANFFDELAECAQRSIVSTSIQLCHGARSFLVEAQKYGARLVVLSGNERRIGWHKLRTAGLDRFFLEGFWGCAVLDRHHLPPIARDWALQQGLVEELSRVIIIGDTPNDISCAHRYGFVALAVASGPYSIEELLQHRPTLCFPDLHHAAVSLQRIFDNPAMNRRLIIAIDGPAGSGKTTTAQLLAERLGYTYIDTGAMYRALTLAALESGVPLTDQTLASLLESIMIELRHTSHGQRTYLNGRDVSERIRQPDVTALVSLVSSFPSVRQAMVRLQQKLGRQGGIVMDGRDIGTAVFPDADVKVFMTADLDTRAQRRFLELHASDPSLTIDDVKRQLDQRDTLDSSREYNPLRRADDAFVLDTSALTIEEQVETILRHIRNKFAMSNSVSQD